MWWKKKTWTEKTKKTLDNIDRKEMRWKKNERENKMKINEVDKKMR